MIRCRPAVLATLLSCAPAGAALAAAGPTDDPAPKAGPKAMEDERTFFKGSLGFAGRWNREHLDANDRILSEQSGDPSGAAMGGGLQAETVSDTYFAFGIDVQFLSLKLDKDLGRSGLIATSPTLRLRLPLSGSDREVGELYVLAGGGLTLHIFSQEFEDKVKSDAGIEPAPVGFGWNILAAAGGLLAVTEHLGLFAEVGWRRHRINHAIPRAGLPIADDVSEKYAMAYSGSVLNAGIVLLY